MSTTETKRVPGLLPSIVRDGDTIKPVKNLGWLLSHWKEVASFRVEKHPRVFAGQLQPDCVLIAILKDGRTYESGFYSLAVLSDWLHRPIFYGLALVDLTGNALPPILSKETK